MFRYKVKTTDVIGTQAILKSMNTVVLGQDMYVYNTSISYYITIAEHNSN